MIPLGPLCNSLVTSLAEGVAISCGGIQWANQFEVMVNLLQLVCGFMCYLKFSSRNTEPFMSFAKKIAFYTAKYFYNYTRVHIQIPPDGYVVGTSSDI